MSRLRPFLAGLLLTLALLLPQALRAHELLPGYLELTETAAGRVDVLWKLPLQQGNRLPIAPRFPSGCRQQGERGSERGATAWIYRASLSCAPPLQGQTIAIDGLEAVDTDVLVRYQPAAGSQETHLLKPEQAAVTLGKQGGRPRGGLTYLRLGIEHILLGVDHLLFVFGLLLIVRDGWMLLKTIAAFTVANSVTLSVAAIGIVRVPGPPLNAAIALSILFIGLEVVRSWRGQTSFTIRRPWVMAFGFGLLHGFGYASGLSLLGLPRGELLLALLLFNLGIEIGQDLFVLLVLALRRSFTQLEIHWPLWVRRLPGTAVGTAGAYWTLKYSSVLLFAPGP
jgi:hydrogenase/urease accessory protein HupE